jgi:hypothetical protein
MSALAFFAVNIWILGIIISDVGQYSGDEMAIPQRKKDD